MDTIRFSTRGKVMESMKEVQIKVKDIHRRERRLPYENIREGFEGRNVCKVPRVKMGRRHGNLRKGRAATEQRAQPTREGAQSQLEEHAPFKTQVGVKAEGLKATLVKNYPSHVGY